MKKIPIPAALAFLLAAPCGAAPDYLYKPTYEQCLEQDIPVVTRKDIYKDGWIDLNKNGKKDVYEDPRQDVDTRIEDLLSQMTVEEKTAQLATLYGYRRVAKDPLPTKKWVSELWKDGIGNIDEHLNGVVRNEWQWPASKHTWAINENQRFFIEDTRLGIPVDFTNEAVGGLNHYKSSNFPQQLGLGATWNRDLVRRTGEVMGKEAHALGYTNIYAPILDVIRDQRWGRCMEDFGEDPYLVSELGIQMVKGIRSTGVGSTLKHFAIHSANKGAREGMARLDPQCSPSEAEAVHLWPFERVIKQAAPEGIMSSYNDYSGELVQTSKRYLQDILRGRMGFDGYVVSDSGAVEWQHTTRGTAKDQKDAVRQSILGGLDVRTNFSPPGDYVNPLRELVKEGAVPMEVLDERVRNVLRVKFRLGLFDRPYRDLKEADRVVLDDGHLDVARQAAYESIVLLKNDKKTLPLDIRKIKTIALCGPNADAARIAVGRYGPQSTEGVVTLKQAIGRKAAEHGVRLLYAKGCDYRDKNWPKTEIMPGKPTDKEQQMIDEAVRNAKEADVAIVAVGDCESITVGESASRTGLNLCGWQDRLIQAVAETGKPVIVVHNSGRANSINYADALAPAIVQVFFPGAYGDEAIADVIFGDYNPGGKVTVTFPKTVGQLPMNFPHLSASQIENPGVSVAGVLWSFGHGLSYTTFEFSDLNIDWSGKSEGKKPSLKDTVTVSCSVRNTGDRAGDEVVQLYTHRPLCSVVTYDQSLRGFERLHLKPGESKTVTFTLTPDLLAFVDAHAKWTNEPGVVQFQVGNGSVMKKSAKKKPGMSNAALTGRDVSSGSEESKEAVPDAVSEIKLTGEVEFVE